MKEIFGKRLKNARIGAGLSQDQLVEKLEHMVTKNAISKYEKGEMMCNGNVLNALCEVFGERPEYFYRPFTAVLPDLEFRKMSALSKKDLESIKIKAAVQLERYLEAEEYLGITSVCNNPLENLLIENGEDVEKAATILLDHWHLGYNSLPNVLSILEDQGVKIIEAETPEKFDGFSGWVSGNIPLMVINRNFTTERKRLTALHELGHLFLKFSPALIHKEIEKLCFRFAGAMLIPVSTFYRETGRKRTSISTTELILLKETYGMSVQAIMARAKDLEVITDSQYLSFRIRISSNRTEEGMGKYKGTEGSKRFRQLVYRAVSEDLISMGKAAELCGVKLAGFRNEYRYT